MKVLYSYKVFESWHHATVEYVILKLACGHEVVQKAMAKVPTQITCFPKCEEKHAGQRVP